MRPYLDVFLGDTRVGTITNLTSDHNVFAFDEGYTADETRPVLSLAFYNSQGGLQETSKTPQVKLLPFFANLLPEGHLREYIARRDRLNPQRDFPLLWLLGEDLPGAVIARHPDDKFPNSPPFQSVVDEAVENDPGALKFSLAGVQLKFSAILEAHTGLTIPAHGMGGQWIVKMPSAVYSRVPENEFSMLTFARLVGLDVPEIGLVDSPKIMNMPPQIRTDLGKAMYIKRFDRDGEKRIHIEDFAQIFGVSPNEKYGKASYANMLAGIWARMGETQATEFVRRLIFSIAIGNGDMHLKNWSVMYRDRITPELSPVYDYVSTVVYVPDDDLALTVARTKNFRQIDRDRLERFAKRAAVPRGIVMHAATEMAERINSAWNRLNENGLLAMETMAALDTHRNSVPFLSARKAFAIGVEATLAPDQKLDEIA